MLSRADNGEVHSHAVSD